MVDISTIHCILFGVCCASGEVREQIHEAWGCRFSPRTAFLVDAEPGSSNTDIVKALLSNIKSQGLSNLTNASCLMTIFLDMTESLPNQQLEMLYEVNSRLAFALQCNISMTLQFGYVGQIALVDTKLIRESVRNTANQNIGGSQRAQLILVAEPVLRELDGGLWTPSLLLLDILRRQSNPAMILPDTLDGVKNNDVGFLSYKEYNRATREKLTVQKEELTRLVGREGSDRFKVHLQKYLAEKQSGITKRFTIDASKQPQHPDMEVPEGGCLSKPRAKAVKGKHKPYNDAKQHTQNALLLTGKALLEDIAAEYVLSDSDADELLKRLMEDSLLGLDLAADAATMKNMLFYSDTTVFEPTIPVMNYSVNGVTAEIGQYLSAVMQYGIYKGQLNLYHKLQAAYDRIPDDFFANRLAEKKRELKLTQERLSNVYCAEDFFARVLQNQLILDSEFSTIAPSATSNTYTVLRGDQYKALGEKTNAYYIDEQQGGLQTLDDAPIKTVRLTLLDCEEENLKDLLPEV